MKHKIITRVSSEYGPFLPNDNRVFKLHFIEEYVDDEEYERLKDERQKWIESVNDFSSSDRAKLPPPYYLHSRSARINCLLDKDKMKEFLFAPRQKVVFNFIDDIEQHYPGDAVMAMMYAMAALKQLKTKNY